MNKKIKNQISKDYGNRKNGKSQKNVEDFSISESAKTKIIALLIFLFGILLLLSIFTYNPVDYPTLGKGFYNIIKSSNEGLHNLMGVFGTYAAYILVENLFGYFSVAFSVVLFAIAYPLFTKKPLSKFITFSAYILLLMMVLSSTFALGFKVFSFNVPKTLYGNSGDFIAEVLYKFLGSAGSVIFIIFALAANIFLLFDSNIIKSLLRLQEMMRSLKEKFITAKTKAKSELSEVKEKKNVISEDVKDTEISDTLKKEREKILKFKKKDAGENDVIKQTEINRPKIVEKIPLEETKTPNKKEIKEVKSLLINKDADKEFATETDVNPDNKNLPEGLGAKDEDDFIEETLNNFKNPELSLLDEPTKEEFEVISDEELNHNGKLLQEKLLMFGIQIEKVFATPGPVVTLYELIPAPDVKLSKIESLQDDIALAMKARGIRMIIPIPGKGTVGVEIPNQKAQIVKIRSILSSQKYFDSKSKLTVAFGKTIDGDVFVDDLSKMPHILIAGATGSGKSVGINTIIASLLFKKHPSDLKFVLIDPKKIELSLYSKLKNHFLATSTDINESIVTSPSNAVSILKSVELEMENRYDKLANAGVRNIDAYNEKYKAGTLKDTDVIRHRKMPYIVVVIDELADLMITAKRDIEEPIARIAQMARAVGIHLIVATQRPSVDVITGVIKANFPVRIAYQVASKIDSRTILDMGGADQLLRNGDMLFMSASSSKPIRIQNAYISMEECERVVEYIHSQQGFKKPYLLPSIIERRVGNGYSEDDRDEMFEEAARLILKLQICSTSTLQRRLKLGYARAARIVDQLEMAGIVGPANGAKGREILISEDDLINYL